MSVTLRWVTATCSTCGYTVRSLASADIAEQFAAEHLADHCGEVAS